MTKWTCHCEADEVSRSNLKRSSDVGNIAMKKKRRDCFASLAMTGGISSVPLIIALVLMITIGTFFISLMTGKHIGASLLAQTTKALYISEAGVEYTAKYLGDNVDWMTVPDISSTSFGNGTFSVAFTNKTLPSVTAASTGTIGNAVRVISINFKKQGVLMLNPVTYLNEYGKDGPATILCEGGTPCDPSYPLDNPPYTCLCTYTPINPAQEVPTPIPPTGVTWLNWSIPSDQPWNYNFAPGTYYFDTLVLTKIGGNDAHVTVSGPVTIWIRTKFEMKEATTFNYLSPSYTNPDNPANVLLIAASSSAEFLLMNTAKFSGAIYAPNGEDVKLMNSAQVYGAIVGSAVELKNTSGVTFDSTAGGLAQGYMQTVTIVATGWGEM